MDREDLTCKTVKVNELVNYYFHQSSLNSAVNKLRLLISKSSFKCSKKNVGNSFCFINNLITSIKHSLACQALFRAKQVKVFILKRKTLIH